MKKIGKLSLATQIFIALVLGIVVGVLLTSHANVATEYIKPIGVIFLNLVQFIVVPIVLFSIMSGVISMRDIRKVGSIGGKTVLFYLLTTAVAVSIGLAVSLLFKGAFPLLETKGLSYTPSESVPFMQTIVNIFPSNFILPITNASMLQVIVMALLLSFGVLFAGEKGALAAKTIDSFNEVFLSVMSMILKLSPLGVFCLITPVVATNGPMILSSLFMVLLAAYIAYILHGIIVYSLSVRTMAGVSPFAFFKHMMPAIMFAFSSASSVGTLPINLECTQKLGANKEVASFVLPLGATINMDGTAIYQGVCTIFIASCFGIELTFAQILTVVLTATLASVGTAGVPGAGMVMLMMVLQSVGLPVEGIALIAGVDRIFDMGRTTVNITGDAACAIVVSKLEEKKMQRQQKKPV